MNEEKKLQIKNNVTGEYEGVVPIKPWTPNESLKKNAVLRGMCEKPKKFICICIMCGELCENLFESPIRWMLAKAVGNICNNCLVKNYDVIFNKIKTLPQKVIKEIKKEQEKASDE